MCSVHSHSLSSILHVHVHVFCLCVYVYVYPFWGIYYQTLNFEQRDMRLTADVRLTRNSRLINGCKIVGGAFPASVRTSESRSGGRFVRVILTLEREEGNNHDKFDVSLLKDATVVGHVLREFSRMWHFPETVFVLCEKFLHVTSGTGLSIVVVVYYLQFLLLCSFFAS